jgi:hypothetical protein
VAACAPIYFSFSAKRAMSDWRFQTARITLFPADTVGTKASELFRTVWHDEPDSFQSATPGQFGPGSQAVGAAKGVSRFVNCQVGRIDIGVGPENTQIARGPTFLDKEAVLGAMGDLIDGLPDKSYARVAFF